VSVVASPETRVADAGATAGADAAVPALSLVVSTRDRGPRLAACLDAVARVRAARPWELVVVDNGSRDGTPALLRDFARSAPMPVTLVHEPRPGLARARNAGVAAARAPLLAFTDDDCYPEPDFVDRWAEVFADPAVGYGAGRIVLHDPADYPITIRTDTEAHAIPAGAFVEPGLVQGANMAFRRAVLDALGGFDPALGPGGVFNFEDLDVASRASAAGFAGGFFPGPTVRHHHRRRLAAEVRALRRSYDHGRGAYYASLLLRPGTRRLGASAWRSMLPWKTRTELLGEMVGAAHYVLYRLYRAVKPTREGAAPPLSRAP
jgi:GT2 family glycosyltransferase